MNTLPTKGSSRRSIADAKAHFAECVRAAERGSSTTLTRHGRPVARIVPYRPGDVEEQETRPRFRL